MKTYPMIQFMIRWGRPLALVASVVILAGGLYKFVRSDEMLWAGIGVFGAIGAYIVMRSLAELIEVVADTLMPR